MPTIHVRDVDLYHEVAGTGPRLVYISGTGGDLRREPRIHDSPLAGRFEVLAYDQRGLGRSSKPDVDYTMADYADDAAALVAALGWDRAHVVGYSFGGMVAQELALRHRERVERLVLCCCAAGGAGGSSYPLHELAGMPLEESTRFRLQLTDTRRDAAWLEANAEQFEALVAAKLAEARLSAGDPAAATGARRQLEARATHDTWDRLASLRIRALVCGGRHDGQARPEVVRELAGRIEGAELDFFDGGHGFLDEDPAAFARIAAFLDG